MLYAVFSDIQGNFEAAARFFRETDGTVDHYLCLGDIVQDGTSFDENRIIDLLRRYGVIAVQGNHDTDVVAKRGEVVKKIHPHNLDYLACLLLVKQINGFQLVHAPGGIRVLDRGGAERAFSFLPPETRIGFYGHSYRPAVYRMDKSGRVHFELNRDDIQLDGRSRYLINPGGIGLLWGAPHTYMVYDSNNVMLELKRLNEGK